MTKYISMDIGFNDDPTCYIWYKKPSKFRRWLRKWLLKWETWELKVIRYEYPEQKEAK